MQLKFTLLLLCLLVPMGRLNDHYPKDSEKIKRYLVPDSKKTVTQKKFSTFISDYKIIQLETLPSCLIGRISKIQHYRDNFYILNSARPGSILVFNNSGKFLRSIGHSGKGPGEYVKLVDFAIDAGGNIFLLCETKKIIELDSSLKLKREFRISGIEGVFTIHRIIVCKDYIAFTGQGKPEVDLGIADLNGHLKRFLSTEPIMGLHFVDRFSYLADSVLIFNKRFNDTIFTVSAGTIKPRHIIDFMAWNITEKEFQDAPVNPKRTLDKLINHNYRQIADYEESKTMIMSRILTRDGGDDHGNLFLINKKTDDQLFCPIIGGNDFFNMAFSIPVGNAYPGEYLVTYYQSFNLLDQYKTLISAKGKQKVKMDYPVLDSICLVIKEDANPILFLFK